MTSIRILPPEVARQIAAGEVVSRPLDVVRELLDNALDAGASRVDVEVVRGGLERVTVRDNGAGIPEGEVPLAPLRHATSKLESVERVTTLGFRGEALWAMAQAGRLTVTTRPAAQLGAVRLAASGDEVSVSRVSAAAGTTVSVEGLFAHLPARLRTQGSAAAEVREVTALLSRYVLHRPGLHWRLTVDGEVRLQHAPSGARGAVASVYGPLSANRVLPMEVPGGVLSGVLSRPELMRSRRDRMHFSVNGRPVLAPPELEQAVVDGYGTLLPSSQAPLCVLDVRVPPEDVNPNVHPAKAVVALADVAVLAARVRDEVRAALSGLPLAGAVPDLHLPEGVSPVASMSAITSATGFPELRPVGVHAALYLLAEGDGDLWIVDVHAAHERVLFERLSERLAGAEALELPVPELLQLTPGQLARLQERQADLQGMGLTLEPFGAGLARLRSLPAAFAALPVPRLHELIVETVLGDLPDPVRELVGRLACAPALKAGHVTLESGTRVLADLSRCGQPWACPHGRPTTLRLSERDLAHSFGRRGPRDVARGRDVREERVPVRPSSDLTDG
ncbi:DNA mismatch repair endonuclease MutL [Deinococcus aquiradiocola]|uniref:DNA mismatch repair protein MutL n=1 Tax=Deinococcus aquiradiocola TaxID=393059 RepID=A0A917UP18_9DEIO|nr:DNA mismatch repair endonuclease MutL [Deinococcus aquiradiocola]GGJ71649.1 DNA mismatch repair protein MutL [Deinococcus aquiradiocola]